MKRLVICCDGTWQRLYGDALTNVALTARSVATRDAQGNPQIVFYSEGVGALWDEGPGGARGQKYAELLKPEGPIYFAGEHLSYVGLWQEGAALSAHEAIKLLQARVAEQGVTSHDRIVRTAG